MSRLPTLTRLASAAVLLGAAACGGEPELRPAPVVPTPEPTIAAYDAKTAQPAAEAALSLVPADAAVVTVTDFDESRAQLGVPDLTSDDLMTDRSAYWEQAPRTTVLLAGGMLREDSSELWLDHGFTQDDVDWEARFTTPEGAGWILGFRPDLDMARVAGAVKAGVAGLGGAEVDRKRHLVSVGMAEAGEDTWGERPGISELVPDAAAESAYYRAGCVPLGDVLGPDAGVEDQDAVLAAHDVAHFGGLEAFSISFVDGKATARLGLDRTDVFARAALVKSMSSTTGPMSGSIGWADGFTRQVSDPSTGRIGWDVADPAAAATLVLTDVLPFAVCPEVTPMEEPTGL
ncbi:hypothetical protein [Nocardioides gansuensis]|uniref:hypothetical protein n=1 Tax=Nocardioides gansuensis TaxID=2138300 RepID=UPI00140333DD|nr:hypothetical protein [Nocardioides gansuensis]